MKTIRAQDRLSTRGVFDDAIATYWSITRHVGPANRNDIFYTRFAVVLLSLSQTVILLTLWSLLFGDLALWIGKSATKAAILLLVAILAGANSLLIFRTDDRMRRARRRFRHRPLSFAILFLYFVMVIGCWAYLFS